MRTRTMLWCLIVLFGTMALHGADVTGKWMGKIPARGGEMRDTTFVFKQDGDKLTGTMTGRDQELHLQEGKVDGDTISFSVVLEGGDIKILYKGTVSGNEIKFTREREGSGQPREFTAKRAES